MKNSQLFRKTPTLDLFSRFAKIFGLTDINDCRKFTRDNLIHYKTLEHFSEFYNELEEYYIPCKIDKYLKNMNEKKLITVLRQIAKTYDYNVISNEKYINSKKVLYLFIKKKNIYNIYIYTL